MIILSGLFCLAMWLPAASPPLVVAFTCFYGFTSGIFISVMPAATGQISPVDKLGARIGAFSTAMALPVLVGTPIAGALIQEETAHGYQPLIIFSVSPQPVTLTFPVLSCVVGWDYSLTESIGLHHVGRWHHHLCSPRLA